MSKVKLTRSEYNTLPDRQIASKREQGYPSQTRYRDSMQPFTLYIKVPFEAAHGLSYQWQAQPIEFVEDK